MQFRGFGGFVTSALIAGAILWSFVTTDVELSRLMSAGPRIADFLGRMFPPDPTV
ncbi:MAG TPA: phosphonate ABC transporter, permease protein PhnE, partial [Erythrobacter sp.]|nr:phosphonate ABC transporter, permease protein PhnE [Erythrobacter sp.]